MIFEKSDFTKEAISSWVDDCNYDNLNTCDVYVENPIDWIVEDAANCGGRCAEQLYRGGKIVFLDHYADDSDVSNSVSKFDNCEAYGDELAYTATLDEIVERINACKDKNVRSALIRILDNEGGADWDDCYIVMQVAFFGEVVYGKYS